MTDEVKDDVSKAREYHNVGLEAFKDGNFRVAERNFREAIGLAPTNPNCWAMLGNALYFQGKKEDALVAYKAESYYRPDGAAAYMDIANILASTGALEEAIGFAMNAKGLKRFSNKIFFEIGRVAAKLGKRNITKIAEDNLDQRGLPMLHPLYPL